MWGGGCAIWVIGRVSFNVEIQNIIMTEKVKHVLCSPFGFIYGNIALWYYIYGCDHV